MRIKEKIEFGLTSFGVALALYALAYFAITREVHESWGVARSQKYLRVRYQAFGHEFTANGVYRLFYPIHRLDLVILRPRYWAVRDEDVSPLLRGL